MSARPRKPPLAELAPTHLFEEARRRLLSNWPLRSSLAGAHLGLTHSDTEVLASVGLSTHRYQGNDTDPVCQSIVDYMALLQTSLKVADVAKTLKVGVGRVRQRIRARSLFAVEYEGTYRLPRFQFEGHRVLPGLSEILGALPEHWSPLDVAQWFLAPTPDLELKGAAVSPRQWLVSGATTQAVTELARGIE